MSLNKMSFGNETNRTNIGCRDLSELDLVSLSVCLTIIMLFCELFHFSFCLSYSSSSILMDAAVLKHLHRRTVRPHHYQKVVKHCITVH